MFILMSCALYCHVFIFFTFFKKDIKLSQVELKGTSRRTDPVAVFKFLLLLFVAVVCCWTHAPTHHRYHYSFCASSFSFGVPVVNLHERVWLKNHLGFYNIRLNGEKQKSLLGLFFCGNWSNSPFIGRCCHWTVKYTWNILL